MEMALNLSLWRKINEFCRGLPLFPAWLREIGQVECYKLRPWELFFGFWGMNVWLKMLIIILLEVLLRQLLLVGRLHVLCHGKRHVILLSLSEDSALNTRRLNQECKTMHRNYAVLLL